MRLEKLITEIHGAADLVAAEQLTRYFQVRPGGYGDGDRFVGVRLSQLRQLLRPYVREPLSLRELGALLDSEVHDHRLAAVVLLAAYAEQARRTGDDAMSREAYEVWMRHPQRINNWDLVDAGAPTVVGGYLLDQPRNPLYRLAGSPLVWERRTSLVATQRFIREGQTADTYALAASVLCDEHPLIHKAAGWMLREAGKRVDERELRSFLDRYADAMPRTMLRYAIERLPAEVRRDYMRR